MTTISASSSIDVQGIVSQLMQIERQPLTALETTLSGIQTKLTAYGKVKSALSNLQDAARALTRNDTWSAAKATSSDETTLVATAGVGAITGGYAIEASQLAQRQSVASSAFAASSTVVGGGTLRVQMGSLDTAGTAFTADPERPEVAITIAAGATLADVRNAINAADAGVTATLVADGTGQRLMLRSEETGALQAFRVTTTDSDGNDTDAAGLSAIAFDPGALAGAGRNLTLTQSAQDAVVKVNGLQVSATGNSLEGVIENVTVDLRRTTTAPVEVTVSSDGEALRAKLDAFVKAYNDLNKLISDQTKYDPATKTAGTLQGQQGVVRIQQQLRETLRSTFGSGALNSLSTIGVAFQRDGSLAIDETKVANALAQPTALKTLFATDGDTSPEQGIAQRLVTRLSDLLDAEGPVSGATDSLSSRKRSVEQQQERLEARMTEIQKRLLRQYTALDANLSRISGSFASIQGLLSQSD